MTQPDPLAGIDSIDWKSLDHAYGPADDVPGLLREIQSSDADIRDRAYWHLYGNIYHQGSRYPATSVTVPFLYKLLHDPDTPDKPQLILYLVDLAIGLTSTGTPIGMDIAGWLEHIQEIQKPGYLEKRQKEYDEAKAKADTAAKKAYFFILQEPEREIESSLDEYKAYQAVQTGLDSIYLFLNHESAAVRTRAAYALAWFPAEQQKINKALFDLLDREEDVIVRATALFSLAVVKAMAGDLSEDAVTERLREVYADEDSDEFVQWVSSVALLKLRSATPKQASTVIRKLTDPTYLAEYEPSKNEGNTFPFVRVIPNLEALAALETSHLKGSEHPELARALISQLDKVDVMNILTLAESALKIVFDGVKPAEGAGYDSFTPLQQELVKALGRKQGGRSHFANFCFILKDWNLPEDEEQLREFLKDSEVTTSKL